MHFVATSAEQGIDIRTQQMAVTARHINIHIRFRIQAVNQPFKTLHLLYLIQHQIIRSLIFYALIQIFFECFDIQQVVTHVLIVLIEGQSNDMVFGHTLPQ